MTDVRVDTTRHADVASQQLMLVSERTKAATAAAAAATTDTVEREGTDRVITASRE